MIRLVSILVGLFFVAGLGWSFLNGARNAIENPPAQTVEQAYHLAPRPIRFASDGPFGRFDDQQLQRGFQVYKEVCAACHSLRHVAFRDLAGIGYSPAEVKAIAAGFEVPGIDPVTGEPTLRPGKPTDYFPSPFPNDTAARAANNGAVPPDLSLIVKARAGGAAYVHSLLTGFRAQPASLLRRFPDARTPPGSHYNPYFADLNLAMAPPLVAEGQVRYGPGNPKPTVDQMATDVSAFLIWTADPKLEKRRQTGWVVIGFLIFATLLGYLSYRQIWQEARR